MFTSFNPLRLIFSDDVESSLIKSRLASSKDNTTYQAIELITDETIRKFTDQSGDYKMDVDDQIFWGDVPVVAFEKPGTTAIFEPAITLIDAYEQILNNINSMTQYNDDAKLKLVGYSPKLCAMPIHITGFVAGSVSVVLFW